LAILYTDKAGTTQAVIMLCDISSKASSRGSEGVARVC